MGFVLALVILAPIVVLGVLGFRWTRPRVVAPDLRRADDANTDLPDSDTITDRVNGIVAQSWPPSGGGGV